MENPAKEVPSGEPTSFPSLRKEMVTRDIAARGVRDELVLDAMRKVPRELFLPEKLREFAYDDTPLPIAGEQTISQPYIVAFMAEALMLKGGERVLEIGAGSGYAAAVLFLVVPPAVKSLAADHVVIGWKDTREARRAVQDALPFLHEAKRITILEICGKDQMDVARRHVDDVVGYLAQHRIKAERRVEIQAHGSGADQIIGLADDEGADLLVTGAYGHNRVNEWIFGGMTRDLLKSSPICCLMSH
jgi:nucleotide-binding universal stress UspA family protein